MTTVSYTHLPAALLMLHQLLKEHLRGGQRVGNGAVRLVGQTEGLPAAGKLPMDGGGRPGKALDEVGAVMGDDRAGLTELMGEVVQRGQQVGPLLLMVQDEALALPDVYKRQACPEWPAPECRPARTASSGSPWRRRSSRGCF